jgi:DNA-damage-inducible protein D
MNSQLQTLQQNLESAVQRTDAEGVEFWFARDLQPLLGYARWENFQTAIKRAVESCKASGHAGTDHFRDITKMVELGSGSKREVDEKRGQVFRYNIHF